MLKYYDFRVHIHIQQNFGQKLTTLTNNKDHHHHHILVLLKYRYIK